MITFLYFNSCPNSQQTLLNLKALKESGDISEIEEIEVPDLESAGKTHFQGSPTILYNGIDIYSKEKPEGFHYTCRIYSIDGEKTGILSKEYIKAAIYELQQQQDLEPDSSGLSEQSLISSRISPEQHLPEGFFSLQSPPVQAVVDSFI